MSDTASSLGSSTAGPPHLWARLASLVIGAALAFATLLVGGGAATAAPANTSSLAQFGSTGVVSADKAPMALSIAVDNGHKSTKVGERLTYTVTVANIGTVAAKKLHITQSMPGGLTFVSADRGGKASKGASPEVSWTVDIAPSKSAVLHTKATVGATPDQLLRLASVACASASAKGAPIVCATHSDLLPAGAVAAAAAASSAAPASATGIPSWTWYAVGAAAVLLVALVVLLRRRARRSVAAAAAAAVASPKAAAAREPALVPAAPAHEEKHEGDEAQAGAGAGASRPLRHGLLRRRR